MFTLGFTCRYKQTVAWPLSSVDTCFRKKLHMSNALRTLGTPSVFVELKRLCISIRYFYNLGSWLFYTDGWPWLALISATSIIFGFWLLVLALLKFQISRMTSASGLSSVCLYHRPYFRTILVLQSQKRNWIKIL